MLFPSLLAATAAVVLLPAVPGALAAGAPAGMTPYHGGSGSGWGSGGDKGSGTDITEQHGGTADSGGGGDSWSWSSGSSGGNGDGWSDGGGGGYTFSNWHQGGIQDQCKNGGGGSYTVTWSGAGNFVCGKGWKPGGPRTVHYSGTYHAKGGSYLALYGWLRNPLVEYYIIESYGDQAPRPGTAKGSYTVDGGVYSVYVNTRTNAPSIDGPASFGQYYSVRSPPRVGGAIAAGRHFDEWRRLGLRLGQYDYMLIAVEAFGSGGEAGSGSASITVS